MFLINEPHDFPVGACKSLEKIGPVYKQGLQYDPKFIKVVFIRLSVKVDSEFLGRYPALTHIVSPTTGLNHIDMIEVARRKIRVIALKGEVSFLNDIHATAEHTLALALALIRKIPNAADAVTKGLWDRYPFKGTEINGSTVLVIGYGRVGKQVSKLYEAFGARVIAFDDDIRVVPKKYDVMLKEGIQSADIISIHIPYSEKNIGFMSEKLFSCCKSTAVIINTSRGEVVDQSALLKCLVDGKLAGAALDVLCAEPSPFNHELEKAISQLEHRLVITPHIAGFTQESLDKVETYVVDLLLQDMALE